VKEKKRMRTAVALVIATLLIAGCSSKSPSAGSSGAPSSSSGDFSMTLSFDPAPPAKGNETITITVKDDSGNAVKGAIVKIGTTMPQMSMTGPKLTAQDNGDGTYSAVANLIYATHWVFDVAATQDGKRGNAEFTADVK
jgi:ABC-type glycerol-3-phosphate transport system substrate-binding protein